MKLTAIERQQGQLTVSYENPFTGHERKPSTVGTVGNKFFQFKAGLLDALPEIASIHSNMIFLAEMDTAFDRADNVRVFIGLIPPLDDRNGGEE